MSQWEADFPPHYVLIFAWCQKHLKKFYPDSRDEQLFLKFIFHLILVKKIHPLLSSLLEWTQNIPKNEEKFNPAVIDCPKMVADDAELSLEDFINKKNIRVEIKRQSRSGRSNDSGRIRKREPYRVSHKLSESNFWNLTPELKKHTSM